jgi:hypothetical protein
LRRQATQQPKYSHHQASVIPYKQPSHYANKKDTTMVTIEDLKPGTHVQCPNPEGQPIDAFIRSHRGNVFLLTQGCTFALDVSNKYFFRVYPWDPHFTIQLREITV